MRQGMISCEHYKCQYNPIPLPQYPTDTQSQRVITNSITLALTLA